MSKSCEKCGCTHIIHIEMMDICNECLSTIVYGKDGSILSTHLTSEDLREYYMSILSEVELDELSRDSINEKLYSLASDIPTILNAYGVTLFKKKNYKTAIEKLKKAVDINPSYGTAYYNLARIYKHREDYLEMNRFLELAEPLIPHDGEIYADFLEDKALSHTIATRNTSAKMELDKAERHGKKDEEYVRENKNENSSTEEASKNVTTDEIWQTEGGFTDLSTTKSVEVDQRSSKWPKTKEQFITLLREYGERLERVGIDSTLDDSDGKIKWIVDAPYMNDIQRVLIISNFEPKGIVKCDTSARFRAPGCVNVNKMNNTSEIVRFIDMMMYEFERDEITNSITENELDIDEGFDDDWMMT